MPDMLVKLYNFNPDANLKERLEKDGIIIKRAIPPERSIVTKWAEENFSKYWADECETALSRNPSACFIACSSRKILGFACCEATAPNYFGPIGVDKSMRGKDVGKALLEACLEHQKSMGYGYCIIGGAGSDVIGFYEKCCGAEVIKDGAPGIYKNML